MARRDVPRILAVAVLLASVVGCDAGPKVACEPTIARMSPPAEVAEFMDRGVSAPPGAVRPTLDPMQANWFGDDALWVSLPQSGEVRTLSEKIPSYLLAHGTFTVAGRRLDGDAPPARGVYGATAERGPGFIATSVAFPSAGCWRVTYSLNGDELGFVLRVLGQSEP